MRPEDKPIGFTLKLIHDSLQRFANKQLKELDLTLSQDNILDFLIMEKRGKTARIKDLEAHFHLQHSTVVGLVKRLEQKGFVLVGKDKKDRRCTQVSCTQKATEKYEAMSTYRKQLDALMVEHMSKTEAAELARLLEILLANLQGIDR